MQYISTRPFLNAVSFQEVIDAVKTALLLLEENKVYMPNRMHINQGENTVLLMPCFTDSVFGTKLVSVFPNNKQLGLPAIQGIMVLNDGKTGKPLAIMDAPILTALRTAGLGAVGVELLSKADASQLGIIGAGVQGLYQTLMACTVRNITDVYVYNRTAEKLEEYKIAIHDYFPNVNIRFCETTQQVVEQSEIIITCTSASSPILPNDKAILANKCYVGVGSYKPDMQEFSEALYPLIDRLFVDNDFATKESGDVAIPLQEGWIKKEQIHRLGTLLKNPNLRPKNNTTVFKSVGMAVLDVVVAELVYRKMNS